MTARPAGESQFLKVFQKKFDSYNGILSYPTNLFNLARSHLANHARCLKKLF